MKKEEFEKYINKIVDERINKFLKSENFQTLLESRLFRLQNQTKQPNMVTPKENYTGYSKPTPNRNTLMEMMGMERPMSTAKTPNFVVPQGTPQPVASVLNILHNKFNLPIDEFSSVESDINVSDEELMSGNY